MPGSREIKQKFKSAIRRGTGEAYLLLQGNPKLDFSKEIIQACVKNFAYDGQCESSRAPYLFELIQLSGRTEEIKPAILAALAIEQKDTWTLSQLFEITKIYAQNGDIDAKKGIYDRFFNNIIEGSDWLGSYEIVDLDGIDGLKFVAAKMGESLLNDPDDWQDRYLIDYLQEKKPALNVWRELEEAGEHNPCINAYLDNIRKTENNRNNYQPENPFYKNAADEVLLTKRKSIISNKKWKKSELLHIAKRLIVEKNQKNLARLLRAFKRFTFPFESKYLLDIANNAKLRNEIKFSLYDALGNLRDDEVRKFATDKLLNAPDPHQFAIILKANYKKGDFKILTEIINRIKNEAAVEMLMLDIHEVYHRNKTKECTGPLEALYNKSNCAMCRNRIVKLLIENDVLPSQIKDEIAFDCDEDTRKLLAV